MVNEKEFNERWNELLMETFADTGREVTIKYDYDNGWEVIDHDINSGIFGCGESHSEAVACYLFNSIADKLAIEMFARMINGKVVTNK